MRALLLAAGRGERLRPHTDTCPKPLLRVGGKRLIEWQIEGLARAGVADIVINIAHLPDQFEAALGDGSRYGARLRYAREGTRAEDARETLGGIVHALSLLGDEPFVVASSDIVTAFDYRSLSGPAQRIARGDLDAHLVLVDNPRYHPGGDMGRSPGGMATRMAPWLTYGNIGLFAPRIFADQPPSRARLFPWLYQFVDRGRVGAEHFGGTWFNVGTPAELTACEQALQLRRIF